MTEDTNSLHPQLGLVGRAVRKFKTQGFLAASKRSLQLARLAVCSVNRSAWFCRNLTADIPARCAPGSIIINTDTDLSVVPWLKKHHPSFPWIYIRQEVEQMQREHHPVIVARHSDQILGYLKIGIGLVYLDDFRTTIPLPAKTALIYDSFVLPDYRKQGIASAMLRYALVTMSSAGYRTMWSFIDVSNAASTSLYVKSGFERSKTIAAVRLFCWTFGKTRSLRLLAIHDSGTLALNSGG